MSKLSDKMFIIAMHCNLITVQISWITVHRLLYVTFPYCEVTNCLEWLFFILKSFLGPNGMHSTPSEPIVNSQQTMFHIIF